MGEGGIVGESGVQVGEGGSVGSNLRVGIKVLGVAVCRVGTILEAQLAYRITIKMTKTALFINRKFAWGKLNIFFTLSA